MDCQSLGDPDTFVRTFVMVPAAMYEQQREAVNQLEVSNPEPSSDAADEPSEDHAGSLPELDVEANLGAKGGDAEATPGPGIPSTRGTLGWR
jgi:hypothetical protein